VQYARFQLLEDPANDERLLAAQLKRLGLYAANTYDLTSTSAAIFSDTD
jgi:hypothetical protein